MRIVSILENQKVEKRIAITPDIAKKYIALGFEISIVENYGISEDSHHILMHVILQYLIDLVKK